LLPSVYLPLAVNCCAVPNGISELCGLSVIVTNAAPLTVNVAVPLTVPSAMAIVLVPVLRVLASPCVPGVLLMVAAPALDELQCPD
jgi:hypothetical protein